MRKKRLAALLPVMAICLSSCSLPENEYEQNIIPQALDDNGQSIMEMGAESEKSITSKPYFHNVPDDSDFYIDWVTVDTAKIPQENLDAFNRLLSEKGYDFALRVYYLKYDNYSSLIPYYNYADIAFAGFNRENADHVAPLISSGYFESLEGYLDGSELYSTISPKLWQSVKYNNSIYTVPNCAGQNNGNCVVFNLDKLDKTICESYSGDITELYDILGENNYIYVKNDELDYAADYGYEYKNGVLISKDGEVINPLDCPEVMSWLTTMNTLYCEGKTKTTDDGDWAIAVTGMLDLENCIAQNQNVHVYTSKGLLSTRYSGSIGILSASNQKEKSFKLLELLHTDEELINTLLFGESYTEYEERDGEEKSSSENLSLFWGLDEHILYTVNDLRHFASPSEKIAFYENSVVASGSLGITINTDLSCIPPIWSRQNLWETVCLEDDLSMLKSLSEGSDIQSIIESVQNELNEKRS